MVEQSLNRVSEHRRQQLEEQALVIKPGSVKAALPTFHPTHARFDTSKGPSTGESSEKGFDGHTQFQWRSRDNRKGRHTLIVSHDHPNVPSKVQAALAGIRRMFTTCPYWDISYLIAVNFTVGSAIFIVCGLFYWLPVAYPSTSFSNEATIGGGVTSVIGATFFEVGAILLIFEAVNENQTGCFGWAVEKLFVQPDPANCRHHHQSPGKQLQKGGQPQNKRSPQQLARRWQWWPTWNEIWTHYIHEIGFVANIILAAGATVFYVTAIMSLPGIYNTLSQGVLWGVYWLTYLIGGISFVISSALLMLETQEHWWKPSLHVLGWHINLWNLIGSVGWTLAASFGYCSKSWCGYQSNLTLLWASFAFFVGSAMLWFESVNKYSIERAPKSKGRD